MSPKKPLINTNARNNKLLVATLKGGVPTLLYISCLYLWVWLAKPDPSLIILVLTYGAVLMEAWGAWKDEAKRDWWRPFSTAVTIIVFVYCVYALAWWLEGYGFLGLVLLVLFMSGYVLVKNRERFMFWIHHIEREFLYGGKTAEERRKKE